MKLELRSGAYSARSMIADAQSCINLFPEINPAETSPTVPMTHYPRSGLLALSAPPQVGRGRGIFALSNGNLYAVVGQNVYYINQNWVWTRIGQMVTPALTPVSMDDNRTTAVLVDGSSNGYTITMANNAFALLVDSSGTFSGSVRVDTADGFLGFAKPNTNQWYLSDENAVTFNQLVQANKTGSPDNIATIVANIRQWWLLGSQQGTEVWYNAGSTPFPMQPWPNVFIPYGCAAPYSAVQSDVDVFWLSRNQQGDVIAIKSNGYEVQAISTRALEYEWTTYQVVQDCVGGTYQQGGHTFVIFHFPTADRTWKYDLATKQWHRGTWIDNNGVHHAERTRFYAAVGPDQTNPRSQYPRTVVGQDWATGQIYAIDPLTYTDNGQPIVFRRSFPHVLDELKYVSMGSFVADFATGGIVGYSNDPRAMSAWNAAFSAGFGPFFTQPAPTIFLRASKTGGATWTNYRGKGLIASGDYRTMLRWASLGMARDWVFELTWAFPGPSALNAAYVEPIPHRR